MLLQFTTNKLTIKLPKALYIIDRVTNCWNWNRAFNKGNNKYPSPIYILIEGKHKSSISARRYIWEIENRPKKLARNISLWPNCNNKKCVNPTHMKKVISRTLGRLAVISRYKNIKQFTNKNRKLIEDEFSVLPLSRQRMYQLRKKKKNLCSKCGCKKENIAKDCCKKCLIKNRKRYYNKTGKNNARSNN